MRRWASQFLALSATRCSASSSVERSVLIRPSPSYDLRPPPRPPPTRGERGRQRPAASGKDCLKRRLRIRYSSTIVFLPPPRGQHRPKQVRSSFCPRRQEAARPHAKGAPRRAPDSCALCGRHLIIAADICTQAFRRWASNVGVASWLVTLLAFPSSTPAPAPRPRIHLTR